MDKHNLQAQRGLSDVVCALPMPGVPFFHLHPHSRHTVGCSFSLRHGGEQNKARKWEFCFPGKLKEYRMLILGCGVGSPWFYSQLSAGSAF